MQAHMIPAVILAAGLSTRMGGRTKALLPLAGDDTFVTKLIRTFLDAGVDDVVVVVGHEAETVVARVAASGLPARIVVNTRYREGQLSSLLAALDAVDRPGVEAMMMTLVDVPLVSVATVCAVLERYRARRPPIVRPVRGADHGHPVILDRALFDAVRAADPEHGAKPIVRAHVSAAGDVPIDDEGAFADVDTPDAYMRLVGLPL
jgi:molybdenum cofactor cytidylyltransferase